MPKRRPISGYHGDEKRPTESPLARQLHLGYSHCRDREFTNSERCQTVDTTVRSGSSDSAVKTRDMALPATPLSHPHTCHTFISRQSICRLICPPQVNLLRHSHCVAKKLPVVTYLCCIQGSCGKKRGRRQTTSQTYTPSTTKHDTHSFPTHSHHSRNFLAFSRIS